MTRHAIVVFAIVLATSLRAAPPASSRPSTAAWRADVEALTRQFQTKAVVAMTTRAEAVLRPVTIRGRDGTTAYGSAIAFAERLKAASEKAKPAAHAGRIKNYVAGLRAANSIYRYRQIEKRDLTPEGVATASGPRPRSSTLRRTR